MEKPRKEKNQNIQVFVRLRPLNQRERDIRSLGVVEVCSNREVLVRQPQAPSITKKFTFDRAFCPSSKQVDVYREVVSPLIEEVLAGYNCTVFAYGQTGTGKTHTMVGESSDHEGSKQSDPMAGIIPRSLGQLFDELRLSNSEFTVRVSYLELYNEELFDLLAPSNGDSKLKMYEASKGSSEVKGLEEIRVRSKDEVYQILAQGQERRRIASTLMNAQSSRSHTVFTIVVKMNMKDSGTEGEELVKTGKLNLVDLAGSENISKAGSDNPGKGDRKRECVVINQSLLTLGRVITALVERQPHIPYRESKLTRLLQESLGGRTKTSIIATISPGHKDLEETLSTLEYAHRARNIQNKPEVNQKVLKTTVLTEYVDENDRLRRDLMASWEKNGVYLSLTTHTETQMQLANQRKEIQEQILQIKTMKEETERLELDLHEKVEGLRQTEELLEGTKQTLGQTKEELGYTKNHLSKMSNLYEEQRYIVSKQSETEAQLSKEALEAKRAAELAGSDAGHLHCTVAKRRKLEEENYSATVAYGAAAREQRARLRGRLHSATDLLAAHLAQVSQAFEKHLADSLKRQEESKQQVGTLVQQMGSAVAEVISTMGNTQEELAQKTSAHEVRLRERMSAHGADAAARLREWSERLAACLEEGRRRERQAVDEIRLTAEQWRGAATSRLQELEREHTSWHAAWSRLQQEAEAASRDEAARRQEHANTLALALMTEQQEMAAAKERLMQELDRVMTRNQTFFNDFISLSDMEMRCIDEDSKSQQEMRDKANSLVGSYSDAFQEKIAAVGGEVDALSRNVVGKVTEAHDITFAEADKANEATKVEMMEVVESVERESEQMSRDASELLAAALECGRDALDTARSHIDKYTSTCSSGVTAVSEYVEREWCAGAEEWGRGAGEVRALGGRLGALREELHAELTAQDSLQESFLQRDYKSYSPTGKTPERTEYRYPRTFAATSPHERLVARLRAQRSRSHDECIEVLDATLEPPGSEGGGSDGDSSRLSTDSAVVFLEPSPPPAAAPAATPTITKSTSESDIFSKRKNGKENLTQAVSLQKLSKLRQPNSHKKILTPKN